MAGEPARDPLCLVYLQLKVVLTFEMSILEPFRSKIFIEEKNKKYPKIMLENTEIHLPGVFLMLPSIFNSPLLSHATIDLFFCCAIQSYIIYLWRDFRQMELFLPIFHPSGHGHRKIQPNSPTPEQNKNTFNVPINFTLLNILLRFSCL